MTVVECEDPQDYKVGMSLSWNNMRIVIYKKALKALGWPKYIRFLFNASEKKICIQASTFNEQDSVVLPDYLSRKKCELNSINMIILIWALYGLEKEKTYQLSGIAYKGYNLVEFNVSEAKCTQPKEKGIVLEA